MAKQKAKELEEPENRPIVMMDPGTENKNEKVLRFTSSSNLIRMLAQVETHYSNSMIENLFRMFKNNYLYHQEINSKEAFYFNQHNNIIPMAAHNGGTPLELFLACWGEDQRKEIEENKLAARKARKDKNMAASCQTCPSLVQANI